MSTIKILIAKSLKNISSEDKIWIIIISIYYLLIFSGIGKNLGFFAPILAMIGWIIVPMTIILNSNIFWERFDNVFLKIIYILLAIVIGYLIYFSVENALNVNFYNEHCRPLWWNPC